MNETSHATVGQSLGLYPVVITWRGRELHLDQPGFPAIAKIEEEVARRILAVPEQIESLVSPEKYQEELAAARLAVAANQHQFGGQAYRTVVAGPDGVALQLWACLRKDLPLDEVKTLVASEPTQALLAYARLVPDFLSAAAARRGTPPEHVAKMLQEAEPKIQALLAKHQIVFTR